MLNARLPKITSRGFTLLEIVIAIALMILITGVIMAGLSSWLKFKQRMETDIILKDLAQATTALYKANAFSIDDNDPTGGVVSGMPGFVGGGLQLNGPSAPKLVSSCHPYNNATSVNDTADLITALKPLQPYLSKPLEQVVSDGFNNRICVLVSSRLKRTVNGVPLYYHAVAFLAPGDNLRLENAAGESTAFKLPADEEGDVELNIDPGGDDQGRMVDGFGIALANYKVTQERLAKLAQAYETYFNVRFLTKDDRDITINYFYANNGSNNGDPGGDPTQDPGPMTIQSSPTLGSQWNHASFNCVLPTDTACMAWGTTETGQFSLSRALSVSDSDARDAWGRPIVIDNRSPRVKAGERDGAKAQPPFSAVFGAFLPGTSSTCAGSPSDIDNTCATFVTMTSIGKY